MLLISFKSRDIVILTFGGLLSLLSRFSLQAWCFHGDYIFQLFLTLARHTRFEPTLLSILIEPLDEFRCVVLVPPIATLKNTRGHGHVFGTNSVSHACLDLLSVLVLLRYPNFSVREDGQKQKVVSPRTSPKIEPGAV